MSCKGLYNLEHKPLYKESVSRACDGKSQNFKITYMIFHAFVTLTLTWDDS